MPTKHVLLTVKEVSEILRIQRPKVYLLIQSGCLTGIKVGADWRVRTDSVEGLIGAIPDSISASSNSSSPSRQ